ncbi:uncharacterized protein STEHIDRAFT_135220 [Stereum hirsutum FP-91666 SS1]|uniref:Uncharacterized protein n=1 Tax=Stereum hirsutum (strain FP-91666) TaxID=721885 RepID=R7RY73_STEHR|nr:uncharacterized protein STEHIDRAFT_135220 [Stereum hirsutum FP-91666 SS1]EIM80284.1 hypothetical protein STEHIDRAFT_135220 [Stereum hirsutum FP-91666 SS1]
MADEGGNRIKRGRGKKRTDGPASKSPATTNPVYHAISKIWQSNLDPLWTETVESYDQWT